MKRQAVLKLMLVLSLIGLAVAGYQTYEHYYLESSICDFTESFSCSSVTESTYGEFPAGSGIAWSVYGTFWFLALLWLLNRERKGKRFENQEFYIFSWLGAGIASVVYLLFIELYVLPMELGELIICPLCTIVHVVVVLLFIMSFSLLKKPIKSYLKDVFLEE